MSLSADTIRSLRQRLGWSVAEMARQMGCTTDLIAKWEAGASLPDSDAMNHMMHLQNQMERASNHVHNRAQSDNKVEGNKLSQTTHRDLLKDN